MSSPSQQGTTCESPPPWTPEKLASMPKTGQKKVSDDINRPTETGKQQVREREQAGTTRIDEDDKHLPTPAEAQETTTSAAAVGLAEPKRDVPHEAFPHARPVKVEASGGAPKAPPVQSGNLLDDLLEIESESARPPEEFFSTDFIQGSESVSDIIAGQSAVTVLDSEPLSIYGPCDAAKALAPEEEEEEDLSAPLVREAAEAMEKRKDTLANEAEDLIQLYSPEPTIVKPANSDSLSNPDRQQETFGLDATQEEISGAEQLLAGIESDMLSKLQVQSSEVGSVDDVPLEEEQMKSPGIVWTNSDLMEVTLSWSEEDGSKRHKKHAEAAQPVTDDSRLKPPAEKESGEEVTTSEAPQRTEAGPSRAEESRSETSVSGGRARIERSKDDTNAQSGDEVEVPVSRIEYSRSSVCHSCDQLRARLQAAEAKVAKLKKSITRREAVINRLRGSSGSSESLLQQENDRLRMTCEFLYKQLDLADHGNSRS
mmetsp:Transcript_5771/g.17212  ORF Transcript_5771/g.17212 Transcript_5771/m.17212 type:complete len:485 (+) Transcript_5771:140-1594(+)